MGVMLLEGPGEDQDFVYKKTKWLMKFWRTLFTRA